MGRLSPEQLGELAELAKNPKSQAHALFVTTSHCAATLAEAIVALYWDDVTAAEQADLVACVESLRRASECADRMVASVQASAAPPSAEPLSRGDKP